MDENVTGQDGPKDAGSVVPALRFGALCGKWASFPDDWPVFDGHACCDCLLTRCLWN